MALGGLWHGASWTFLLWGLIHGAYLTINHLWREYYSNGAKKYLSERLYKVICWNITFVAILVAWVFFRATSFSSALLMLHSMFDFGSIAIPSKLYDAMGITWPFVSSDVWSGSVGGIKAIGFILIVLIGVIYLPNSQQLLRTYRPVLDEISDWKGSLNYSWSPSIAWAVAFSVLLAIGISRLGNDSTFLYFNF
jgi:uncharacterized membrane protein YagU involved in acid resistance